MNANRQTTIIKGNNQESKMKITTPKLIRWAGLSAMGAGIIFVGIQPIHPLDVLASVTTTHWAIIQSLKTAMCIFGLLGLTDLYARQANEAGWLGLAGYLLFSLFFAHTLPYPLDRTFAVPTGLALAWLGYALWSERREQVSEPVPDQGNFQLRQTGAE